MICNKKTSFIKLFTKTLESLIYLPKIIYYLILLKKIYQKNYRKVFQFYYDLKNYLWPYKNIFQFKDFEFIKKNIKDVYPILLKKWFFIILFIKAFQFGFWFKKMNFKFYF